MGQVWWLAPIATTAIGLGFYMLHNTLHSQANVMQQNQWFLRLLSPWGASWGEPGEHQGRHFAWQRS
jgi:hypothetical protein